METLVTCGAGVEENGSADRIVQCEVTVVRDASSEPQTFALCAEGWGFSSGLVLRFGRAGPGVPGCNDVVLDCEGVSAHHAEMLLSPQGALVVRDLSKNGTGVRPGPDADFTVLEAWRNGHDRSAHAKDWPWEALRRGVSREIGHGWQLAMPLRTRLGANQSSGAEIVTVYVGNPVTAAEAADLDGDPWEPEYVPAAAECTAPPPAAPPPPPDLGGGAFEEPPPAPPEPSNGSSPHGMEKDPDVVRAAQLIENMVRRLEEFKGAVRTQGAAWERNGGARPKVGKEAKRKVVDGGLPLNGARDSPRAKCTKFGDDWQFVEDVPPTPPGSPPPLPAEAPPPPPPS